MSFDALATDGSGNYLKCLQSTDGSWQVAHMATRGYGKESKAGLKQWIVDTYSTDTLTTPPPVTEDSKLLKLKDAVQQAGIALKNGVEEVVLPVGFEYRKLCAYKVVKDSAFIFQDPSQRERIVKQIEKFKQKTEFGLEILALRRKYRDRPQGSIQAIAEEIYDLIQEGCKDLTKPLHLNRKFEALAEQSTLRRAEIDHRRRAAKQALLAAIDTSAMDMATLAAAIICTRETLPRLA